MCNDMPGKQGDAGARSEAKTAKGIHVYCPASVKEELRLLSELNMMDSSQVARMAIRLLLDYYQEHMSLPAATEAWSEDEEDVLEAAEDEEDFWR